MESNYRTVPNWMTTILKIAGLYNIAWGISLVLFPSAYLSLIGMPTPIYPAVWQMLGIIVGVYGIGYVIAARNPIQHWLLILIGLLGKVLGPLAFLWALGTEPVQWRFGLTLVFNDLIWWLPFLMILYRVAHVLQNKNAGENESETELEQILANARTESGIRLFDLSQTAPTHLIFLRHFGCTFCRETLADIGLRRTVDTGAKPIQLVFVHMSSPCRGEMMLNRYYLSGVEQISDPHRHLYQACGFERARLGQLLGPKVLWRGLRAMLTGGHWTGRLEGDGFQLPGRVLLYHGKIREIVRYKTAADHPSAAELKGITLALSDS